MKKEAIINIISSLLIFLFLYAAGSKFVDFEGFKYDMYNQPFPAWFTTVLVWTVPEVEIILAILLLGNKTRLVGLWGSLILMSLFTIYTIVVLTGVFNRVPCSCGGIIKKLTWTQHSILNAFFVGITIWAIILTKKMKLRSTDNIKFSTSRHPNNWA